MITTADFKQYFWYLLGMMGVIFFWSGVWDGLGNIGWLKHPLVSLLVGLVLLAFSPLLFKEKGIFGEGIFGKEKGAEGVLLRIQKHPQKHLFHISYHDSLKGRILLPAHHLKKIEKEFLVFLDEGKREIFIPLHRVREILYQGKTHWKAK